MKYSNPNGPNHRLSSKIQVLCFKWSKWPEEIIRSTKTQNPSFSKTRVFYPNFWSISGKIVIGFFSNPRWKILYRRDTVILRYGWFLLSCCACIISFNWPRDRQRLQLLASPGWNPAFTRTRLVSKCIRFELSWPLANSRLASTTMAHLGMKQDQVPVTQNRWSRSSQVKQ
jgi:hypothetical protein